MTCFRSPYQDELKTSNEVWGQHVHTAVFKMDNQQEPIVVHRELCSCYVAAWRGGELGGEGEHVYV